MAIIEKNTLGLGLALFFLVSSSAPRSLGSLNHPQSQKSNEEGHLNNKKPLQLI